MKRLLSLALTLVLVLSLFTISASAASYEAIDAAYELNSFGLFSGVGTNADGTTNFDLDRTPTRAEAVTMLVRLLGKETEAKSEPWSTPFSDVAEWAKPYVGYAYAKGLTTGVGRDGKGGQLFGGSMPTTAMQYLTFVLRALGYSSETDFKWNESYVLTDKLGITSGEYNKSTPSLTRGDLAIISYHAANTNLKDTSYTLLEVLQNNGIISKDSKLSYHDVEFSASLSAVPGLSINKIEALKAGSQYRFKIHYVSNCDRSFSVFEAGNQGEAPYCFDMPRASSLVIFNLDASFCEKNKRIVCRFSNEQNEWNDYSDYDHIYIDTDQLLEK